MGGDEQLVGPDLAHGVKASEVTEGAMLSGHFDGEPVLVARCEGQLYALGSKCPHYGAPLAEGMIVGRQLRCPWHHAAFNLDTGEIERPPAFHDLPCFNVEEHDGVVRVVGRRETNGQPSPISQSRSAAVNGRIPSSVVVVGGGAAGAVAVGTLRNEGFDGRITLVTAERTAPVDRPNLSKDFLAGNAPEEWMPLRSDEWYADNRIELLTSCTARSLDVVQRTVTLDDGRALSYDALLVATGSDPVRLPLGDGATVHYLRTWDDSRAIIAKAATAQSAVVIGASFIGLEVAASLRTRGLAVTVVAPEHVPMERVLGEQLGRAVQALHESRGVRFQLGRTVKQVEVTGVTLDDVSWLGADLVVAGVGVRPNLALAESGGLTIDRGIVVNEFLETSAPGVWAAGDVARWPDPHTGQAFRVEHWVVAERQGRTAARNILGARERFDAVPFFWSAHYDVTINYVGHSERADQIEVHGDPRANDCLVRYLEKGRLAAVATIGRDRTSLAAEAAMEGQFAEQASLN